MNKHMISPATATSRTRRAALGAASVLTAGALLGVGAQGATAAPLSSEPTSSSSSSAGGSSTTTTDAFLASVTKELRADLSHGQSWNVKAQKVATTVSEQSELFESLPTNLQDDLTTLKDASGAADRATAVDTVRTTALAGGYGEEITTIAEAVRDNPQHPLAAAVRAALGSDVGTASGEDSGAGQESAADTGFSVTELALKLADNPALLEKLPADLQTDLADLKGAPADEQEAAAEALEAAALNGDYGTEIQKLAERVAAHVSAEADADANVGGDADASADANADADADANVGADADAHAGN
ncbi:MULTISPECIES: hypothetical protein [Cryobacterium]|uniref:hypothetical protein n=1 Tax=Cryobacterium TaxID=69578 RepID=UPI0015E8DA49|nr:MULTISPECIES: hypothetical protein [Cryobacterium]